MAVEQLAIINGPLQGLGLEENGPIDATSSWLRQHDMNPSWVLGGMIIGGLLGRGVLEGVVKGALVGAGASWLCHRVGS